MNFSTGDYYIGAFSYCFLLFFFFHEWKKQALKSTSNSRSGSKDMNRWKGDGSHIIEYFRNKIKKKKKCCLVLNQPAEWKFDMFEWLELNHKSCTNSSFLTVLVFFLAISGKSDYPVADLALYLNFFKPEALRYQEYLFQQSNGWIRPL